MAERLSHMLDFDPSGSMFSSLMIILIVCILAIIVGCLARKADPTKPSKGLLMWGEYYVERLSAWVKGTMGEGCENFTGYFMALASYLFLSFIWSITGLPSVVDYLAVPLSLACVMFFLIQYNALKYQRWSYFHRYIEPVAFFLPINLITMWSPIISTTLRMFGNSLSGFIIITLVSWVLEGLSGSIFQAMGAAGQIWLAPIPVGILNLYFALFSGYIQTLVFCSLNAVWISQERTVSQEAMGTDGQALRPASN